MCRNNLGKDQIIDGLILRFANKKNCLQNSQCGCTDPQCGWSTRTGDLAIFQELQRTLSAAGLTRSAGGPPALRT